MALVSRKTILLNPKSFLSMVLYLIKGILAQCNCKKWAPVSKIMDMHLYIKASQSHQSFHSAISKLVLLPLEWYGHPKKSQPIFQYFKQKLSETA